MAKKKTNTKETGLPTPPINSTEHDPLITAEYSELKSYKAAIIEVLKSSFPFLVSRTAALIYNVGNSLVFVQLGNDVIAAVPVIYSLQYTVIGSIRGALSSTGIFVGELFITKRSEKEIKEIGLRLRQSWSLGSILSVPAICILVTSDKWLNLLGIPNSVSLIARDYFYALAPGIPPALFLVSNQQFAQGIKERKISLLMGSSVPLVEMLIGYILALGIPGYVPRFGITGLAYGSCAAVWLIFIITSIYFFLRQDFQQFELFKFQYKDAFKGFSRLLYLSVFQGFQVLAEWGNIFLISMLSGRIGKSLLTAEEPSLQLLSLITLLLFGLMQSTGILVANAVGEIKASLEEGNPMRAEIWQKNAYRLGSSGMIIALIASGVACGLFAGIPRQLSSLFINVQSIDPETDKLVQVLLLIVGVGLLADSVRNVAAGLLSGFQKALFAPMTSLICMSAISLPIAYFFNAFIGGKGEALFIMRDVGILAATICIVLKWSKESSLLISNTQQKIDNSLKNISNSDSNSSLLATKSRHFKSPATEKIKNEKNTFQAEQSENGKEEINDTVFGV